MPFNLQTLSLVAALVHTGSRQAAARTLARHLNAEVLSIFIADPDVGLLLPAPGFPQTLSGGRAWRTFLAECRQRGYYSASLPVSDPVPEKSAVGGASADGSAVVVLLGGAPTHDDLAGLVALLPVLAAAFQGEQVALTAAAQARLARDAEAQAKTLAEALESARGNLQQSLREAQRARERSNFLAEASAHLVNSLAYRTALQEIARLAVACLADCCGIYLLDEQQLRRVGLSCGERARQLPPERLDSGWRDTSCGLLATVLRTRETILISGFGAPDSELAAANDEFSALARDLGLTSVLGVPIVSRDRTLGALLLAASASQGHYDSADLSLAEELARRIALAVDNAQLYAEARHLNADLEQRVLTRTTELRTANAALETEIAERKRVEGQLAQSNHQLQELSASLQAGLEEERTRMAREIHDVFGQELTALRMEVGRLQRHAGNIDATGLLEMTRSISQMIDNSIQTVRRLATDLRPAILDDFGLVAAIEWQVQEFEKRSGIRSHFLSDIIEVELNKEATTAVFRLVQEALTNVARHAHADAVDVRFQQHEDDLVLQVHDNGRGMGTGDLTHVKSLGLVGMRERVRQFFGQLTIQSTPGQGTTVIIKIPRQRKQI